MAIKDNEILKQGFEPNDWYENGVRISKSFVKDKLLVEKLKNGNLRIDGTDVIIKNIKHLKICDKAFNFEYK